MVMTKTFVVFTVVVAGVFAVTARSQQPTAKASPVEQHIATFDDLDFNVFTHQKWDELKKSHSNNVIVHWPDGHQTKGIEKHIEDLKAMFVYAPDTRILVHP